MCILNKEILLSKFKSLGKYLNLNYVNSYSTQLVSRKHLFLLNKPQYINIKYLNKLS